MIKSKQIPKWEKQDKINLIEQFSSSSVENRMNMYFKDLRVTAYKNLLRFASLIPFGTFSK